jgi:hypothetical protein
VAYADYDPVVLAHARALLADNGNVTVVEGNLLSPAHILTNAARLLDFSQPVALLLVAVLHFVGDDDMPYDVVRQFTSALPPGSYVAVTHSTPDHVDGDVTEKVTGIYSGASARVYPRTLAEVAKFLDGLDLVPPGVVNVATWRPELEPRRPTRDDEKPLVYGGIGKVIPQGG